MKRMLPLLLLAILAGFVFLPSATQAWDDCPYGMVNDTYPGSCPRYVDTDGDGICDHSQLPPEEREASSNSSSSQKTTSEGSLSIKNSPLKGVLITFVAVFLAALVTELMVRGGRLKKITARYVWNILLTIGFFISAISGILLLSVKDSTLLTLHTLSSLTLLWMGLYHVIKRFKYYIIIPGKRKG